MAKHGKHRSRLMSFHKAASLIAVLLGTAALNACSEVPDAVNPAEWYRGTVDYFADEDKAKERKDGGKESGLVADRGKAPPGADKPFPNLASVDRQARARASRGGLSADPERPRYAPAISRQGEAASPLQAKPAPPPAPAAVTPPTVAAMPAPTAVPTRPVIPVPLSPPSAAQPAVAAAPSSPKLDLSSMTNEQKEMQSRLTKQLAEIRSLAAKTTDLPVTAPFAGLPSADGTPPTVIVSSGGISTTGFGAAEQAPPLPSVAGSGIVQDRRSLVAPGGSIRVATILFGNGSSKLKARDKRILSSVYRVYRKNGGSLRVVGHASSRTRNLNPIRHKMANFGVSMARADQVAGELMRLGVKKENILVAAVSDSSPVYYEFMPSGEAGNRRAEIYLEN